MAREFTPWFVFLITVLAYCSVVFMAAVNLPFYDDITQILWILNEFIDPKLDSTFVTLADTPDKLHALFYPNAGHIPLGTRLFSLLQYYAGGVNFQVSVWAANSGWIFTMLFFIHWCMKNNKLPLFYMLPVPFLFMSITHWEAMSMTLGGWQMYWGAALFPMLLLIAAISGLPFLASCLYFGALFESGGSLCLYPLVLGFFLLRKEWRNFLIFGVLGGLQVGLFLHFNPIASNIPADVPDSLAILKFMLAFLGNIYSQGIYDLQPLATVHITIGALLLAAGIFCIFNVRDCHLPKLLFIYLLLIAAMAIYKRSGLWVVSRYSVFGLLAASCVYYMLLKYIKEKWSMRITTTYSLLATCCAAGLWISSLYYCIQPLREDHKSRVMALQQYISTGDASSLMWNGPWASEILSEAKRLGVYDYGVGRTLTP